MKKTLSLKDVSKALGVSTATISNAFNRPDQLSSTLREKILNECKTMGYSGPSLAARSLRSGKSDVIGVMLLDSLAYSFSDPMANRFMAGISEMLALHQKQLLLFSSSMNSASQLRTESLPDGFIFYGTPLGNSLERIMQSGKPCVAVDFHYADLPSVNIDNFNAAQELAEHAVTQSDDVVAVIGMRIVDTSEVIRVAPVHANLPKNVEVAWQRLSGFMQGAKQNGVDVNYDNVVHIPVNTFEYAKHAAGMLLSQEQRPTVILCMSDIIAMAVCERARELGLRIPDDIKVTGFDDIPEAARHHPGLTTCCQQGIEKGRLAARMLLANEKGQQIVPSVLKVRQST